MSMASRPHSSSRDLVENILDAGLPPDEVALEVSCEEIVSLAQDYRDLEEQLEAARRKVRIAGGDIRHLEEQLEKNQKDYEDHVAAIFEQFEALRAAAEVVAGSPFGAEVRGLPELRVLLASNPAERR